LTVANKKCGSLDENTHVIIIRNLVMPTKGKESVVYMETNVNKNSLLKKNLRSTRIAAAVFLAPVLIILAIFIVYPIIDSTKSSFFNWSGISADKAFIGLDNWKQLMHDDKFWSAFVNNLIIMVLSIAIQLPIGMALATFLDIGGKKFNFFKVVFFLPMLMSSVAVGFLFRYALDANTGLLASFTAIFGGNGFDLLGDPSTALVTVISVICWQFIPFYMIYFVAAYSGLSYDVYEAAIIDGATRNQYFWKIALPMMRPAIVSAITLSMIGSLKYFDLIYVMTGGGPGTSTELMATYMYKNAFVTFNMGYGSTVATAMFILITIFSLTVLKVLNKKERV
jgi:raffinose/stachyose/melibiose transport system permease protein